MSKTQKTKEKKGERKERRRRKWKRRRRRTKRGKDKGRVTTQGPLDQEYTSFAQLNSWEGKSLGFQFWCPLVTRHSAVVYSDTFHFGHLHAP